MKYYLQSVAVFIISVIIIPICCCLFFRLKSPKAAAKPEPVKKISVFFHNENCVREMDIEEYLKGVVSAEMPATFEEEALKAQAVAARSYAICKTQSQNSSHPNADVCTDYRHCKAYISFADAKKSWGKNAKKYYGKICRCVNATQGEVITYNGEACLAVFHSQSGGGKTESSKDVWGGDVPYLVSVESHGEESAPNFYSEADYHFSEFKRILKEGEGIEPSSLGDITDVAYSDGKSVLYMVICGKKIKGSRIRELFSLRSTCFSVSGLGEYVRFSVTGYGHGVGMSQYGANAMAKEGKTYRDILRHYYTGISINAA